VNTTTILRLQPERARHTRLATAALALGGGFLVALSMPPWGWWPLAFVGIALFEIALGPAPGKATRWWRGVLFGFAWLAMGTGWMIQLTVPGYIVASIIFAAFHGVAALIAPTGRWGVLGRPAAHALVEAIRFSFPFGGVPLASLGISQVGGPLAGVARVGGVILITWVVLQVGFALGVIARKVPTRQPDWVAFGGIAAVAAVALLAVVAPRGHDTGRTLDIVAVQGGGEQGTSALEVPSRLVTERHVEATSTLQPDESLDMVLWPENVIDTTDFPSSEQYVAVAAQARRLGVPIAVGITEDVPGERDRVTNAQVVVTPDGAITSRYDKVRRVPFGEYVPLRGMLEAIGAPVDEIATDAIAGTAPAVLDLPDGTRLAVVISWEVFFGGRAREGVDAGGQVILNPTNGASYTGTIVQTQQVASSRLRAIETGRWLVQAAPTGFSEFVTPNGRVIDRTAVSEQAVIRHTVGLRSGRTWYVTLGDRPWFVLLVLTLLVAWLLVRLDDRRVVVERIPAAPDEVLVVSGPAPR
jgi:apolipoprotein N-acyltransferase